MLMFNMDLNFLYCCAFIFVVTFLLNLQATVVVAFLNYFCADVICV